MKRHNLDAWIFVWLGVGPELVNLMNQEPAKAHLGAFTIWAICGVISILNIAASNFKSFRSTTYADYLTSVANETSSAKVQETTNKEETK